MNILQLLKKKYPSNECVVLREVSDSTGGRSRSLDYMVINLWPSRGLSITGIELKSNRSDWLRELKDPAKQERHFKFCDYFYLLTNGNVAKIEEIPETWGWMEIVNGRFIVKKDAPKLIAEQVTRNMLCAMLRRADEKDDYVLRAEIQDEIKAAEQRGFERSERQRSTRKDDFDYLKETVAKFQEQTGVDITAASYKGFVMKKEVGEAVKIVLENDIHELKNKLEEINKISGILSKNTTEAIKLLNTPKI